MDVPLESKILYASGHRMACGHPEPKVLYIGIEQQKELDALLAQHVMVQMTEEECKGHTHHEFMGLVVYKVNEPNHLAVY